jgi:hypothetical protein
LVGGHDAAVVCARGGTTSRGVTEISIVWIKNLI